MASSSHLLYFPLIVSFNSETKSDTADGSTTCWKQPVSGVGSEGWGFLLRVYIQGSVTFGKVQARPRRSHPDAARSVLSWVRCELDVVSVDERVLLSTPSSVSDGTQDPKWSIGDARWLKAAFIIDNLVNVFNHMGVNQDSKEPPHSQTDDICCFPVVSHALILSWTTRYEGIRSVLAEQTVRMDSGPRWPVSCKLPNHHPRTCCPIWELHKHKNDSSLHKKGPAQVPRWTGSACQYL